MANESKIIKMTREDFVKRLVNTAINEIRKLDMQNGNFLHAIQTTGFSAALYDAATENEDKTKKIAEQLIKNIIDTENRKYIKVTKD